MSQKWREGLLFPVNHQFFNATMSSNGTDCERREEGADGTDMTFERHHLKVVHLDCKEEQDGKGS